MTAADALALDAAVALAVQSAFRPHCPSSTRGRGGARRRRIAWEVAYARPQLCHLLLEGLNLDQGRLQRALQGIDVLTAGNSHHSVGRDGQVLLRGRRALLVQTRGQSG